MTLYYIILLCGFKTESQLSICHSIQGVERILKLALHPGQGTTNNERHSDIKKNITKIVLLLLQLLLISRQRQARCCKNLICAKPNWKQKIMRKTAMKCIFLYALYIWTRRKPLWGNCFSVFPSLVTLSTQMVMSKVLAISPCSHGSK